MKFVLLCIKDFPNTPETFLKRLEPRGEVLGTPKQLKKTKNSIFSPIKVLWLIIKGIDKIV